jgi:hypothetical protein
METLDKDQLPGKNKEQLLADQERIKAEMEYQLDGIKEDAADVGKKALIVGGSIYAGYKLLKFVAGKVRKKKDDYHASGRPLVIRKEKVGPTFASLVTQQLLTIAMIVIASQIQAKLKDQKPLNE